MNHLYPYSGLSRASSGLPHNPFLFDIPADLVTFDCNGNAGRGKGHRYGWEKDNGYSKSNMTGAVNNVTGDGPTPVPEPAKLLLLGVSLVGVAVVKRIKEF